MAYQIDAFKKQEKRTCVVVLNEHLKFLTFLILGERLWIDFFLLKKPRSKLFRLIIDAAIYSLRKKS